MAKHRAIPLGFITVGEATKKIGVTVTSETDGNRQY